MKNYILEIKNICKSFSGVQVLENVNFSVQKGHIHALAGCNGAGKSVLMKILTGVMQKDSGTISLKGKEVSFMNYLDANKAGIRMIFQELSLIPTLSIAENIFLNHEIKKGILLDEKQMNEQTAKLLKNFDIVLPPKIKIMDLSVGQQQMVEIVKAISKDADIVVMDEPTAPLTDIEVNQLFNLMRLLKSKGITIIYISHRMGELLQIADDVTVIRNGRIITTKPVEDMSIELIVSNMLGEKQNEIFEHKNKRNQFGDKTLLKVEHLHVNDMVNDISFNVKKGEVVGFAGLMGCGRTEILETLFGIRKMHGGTVKLNGKEIKIKSVKNAMDAGFALVPEDRKKEGLVIDHTINDNMQLTLFDKTRGKILLNKDKLNSITQKSIKELDIKTDSSNKVVRLLSGGNQQKVTIAKWLERKPMVLLMDEPTIGVDVGAKREIIKIISNYAEKGNGIVMVSSEIEELLKICDRIIILCNGKITAEFSRQEIENEEMIQDAIQGKI